MTRAVVVCNTAGGRKPSSESLGTSSTGDCVVEVDLTKFKNFTALKAHIALVVLPELASLLPGP